MVVLFYVLWSAAVARVLLSPFTKVARKGMWIGVILVGIWLCLGALTYKSYYAEYQVKQKEFESKKDGILVEKIRLEKLYKSHPTSRDVLLKLALLAYQFGEREKLLQYVETLRAVDPNNAQVRAFIQSIQ
jgi:hypothetical protein